MTDPLCMGIGFRERRRLGHKEVHILPALVLKMGSYNHTSNVLYVFTQTGHITKT